MAGFQLSINGRFWVSTEGDQWHLTDFGELRELDDCPPFAEAAGRSLHQRRISRRWSLAAKYGEPNIVKPNATAKRRQLRSRGEGRLVEVLTDTPQTSASID